MGTPLLFLAGVGTAEGKEEEEEEVKSVDRGSVAADVFFILKANRDGAAVCDRGPGQAQGAWPNPRLVISVHLCDASILLSGKPEPRRNKNQLPEQITRYSRAE